MTCEAFFIFAVLNNNLIFNTMAWAIIIGFILFVIIINANKNKQLKSRRFSNERNYGETYDQAVKSIKAENVSDVKVESYNSQPDVFFNNWGGGAEDFSYLTPGQARHELRKRKEEEGYIDNDVYYGLMDVIASEKDEKYLKIVEEKSHQEVERWFRKNIENSIKMSTNVWMAVGEKLAPVHEDYLISEMYNRTSNTIESFVRNRKPEGYFFSEKAYKVANDIYYNRYEPIIKKQENQKLMNNLKRNLLNAKRSYDEAVQNNDQKKMSDALERINSYEKQIEELSQHY